MTYVVHIDEAACAAHGDCVDVAPDVFELDDVAQRGGTGPDELLLAAAEACPSAAILIIDAETRGSRLSVRPRARRGAGSVVVVRSVRRPCRPAAGPATSAG